MLDFRKILDSALKGFPNALVEYGPDGGWIEGPTYWNYATRYVCYAAASCLSAFGTDFGLLSDYPYIENTGLYRMHVLSPYYIWDNFGDVDGNLEMYSWAMMFLAHERKVTTSPLVDGIELPLNILHLFFSRAEDSILDFPNYPPAPSTDAYFRHVEVVAFRTTWEMGTNNSYYYGAIKGGDTTQTHQDLDLGQFVVEKNKKRFVVDLGADNYNLPNYFGNDRYTYYRCNTSGHNTLAFNGNWNQQITQAQVTKYVSGNNSLNVEVDLSAAYAPNATSVLRVLNFNGNNIQITDTIEANANTQNVTWRFHTQSYSVSADDARRLSKETYERKNNLDKKHPGSPTPFVEAYDDLKEHKEWKNKHHDRDNFKGHHKFKHHFNLTTYFVEDNLPPNVYVVLEDKGIQVKAAYERMENSSTLTKVGIQVHNNYIVVSANGNLAVDGKEFNLKEIESIPLENGEMIRKHRSLIVKYDVYRIIMKVRGQHKDKHNKRDKDNKNNKNKEEKKEHKKSHKLPRVSVIIGVEKNAVVKPTGFIGERIAVDPTKYTSAQAI